MADKYHRILLHRVKDARLIKWLEKERQPGERPSTAIKRKLYKLEVESKQ